MVVKLHQPIIRSMLDTDFYKLTMQQAVCELYPNVKVKYKFYNRRKTDKFTPEFLVALKEGIQDMTKLALTLEEKEWLAKNYTFLKPTYLEYLFSYRFNPDELKINLTDDGELEIEIEGYWRSTILWEVPLMALISETYFNVIGNDWTDEGQSMLIFQKGERLKYAGCTWADFGTRRRRSFTTQETVVSTYATHFQPNFVGTSNVHLAHKYNVKALGTQGHEWPMAISVLESLKHANRFAMQRWTDVYRCRLGTVLPDTYGTEAFLQDFDNYYAGLFDSIRHDSGDPFVFARRIVKHLETIRISPNTKKINFSDGLDVDLGIELTEFCRGLIGCTLGIGTHLTNDFPNSKFPALQIVIKLDMVDGEHVVKLSENPEKAVGDPDAVRVVKYTFFKTPLDSQKPIAPKTNYMDCKVIESKVYDHPVIFQGRSELNGTLTLEFFEKKYLIKKNGHLLGQFSKNSFALAELYFNRILTKEQNDNRN